MTPALQRLLNEAKEKKDRDSAPLEMRRKAMAQHHRLERETLDAQQRLRWDHETVARTKRFSTGLRDLWHKLSGEHARTRKQNEAEAFAALQRDRAQRQALIEAQLAERRALQSEIRKTRSHHAELFQQLRQERSRYKDLAGRNTRELKTLFEHVKQLPERHSRDGSHEESDRPTTHSDRLQTLRNRKPAASQRERQNGPEIER